MQRFIILISLFLSAGIANAQQAKLDKAEKMVEDGFFEKAFDLTEAALEDEVTKKNPLTYYLHSRSLFELSKDPFFVKRNPDIFKDACKMALKGKAKDKEKKYTEQFEGFINDLVAANNDKAFEEYSVNRFSKAIKLYNTSYSLNGDLKAYYMIGKSYEYMKDTANTKSFYRSLIRIYDDSKTENKELSNPEVDPFIFLADVYSKKRDYDSANYFLDIAIKVFGEKNAKINYTQYLISKQQILSQPPSSLMMEVVSKALKFSPTDTFLIKKENALTLYMIRNGIEGQNLIPVDSMIFKFARAKALKASNPDFQSIKAIDIFLEPFAENVLWKMSDYYYTNTHDKASIYLAKKYIIFTANANPAIPPTEKEIIARWIKIIQFTKDNGLPGYTTLLMNQAATDYPKSKEITELKKKLLTK